MFTLSAIILALNEEKNLPECLASVAFADQVIVFDAFSTDRTVDIARERGAVVHQHTFTNYAAQRDAALQVATKDWVLFVDADERVTPELASEIRALMSLPSAQGPAPIVGYWIPRRNIIFGQWIRHAGWYPDYQLRLLRRGRARYDPARPVHELVLLDGEAGYLQNPFIHYNYDTLAQFIIKQQKYTDFEAGSLLQAGQRARWRSFVGQPWREFWRRYVTLQGYKDGAHGLLLSLLMGYYQLVIYRKLYQLEQSTLTKKEKDEKG